ncbi:metal-dependent hydrolase [Halobacteria archaeon AArc-m2/3/4]|uniref:Metal-dependent hydrolase n=1 Tax=Natronoglomus mannanivorans TaxID=2979990 RepID=A0ABT2QKA5_9EURY|nr:metal-dependent hydrolase [Halobacteria archaeon AArc-m2/3/4]
MPDLLTHVLAAYILAMLLARRYEWLTPSFVTVVMIGAAVPDLDRIGLVIPEETIRSLLGVPFVWGAIHTLGGSVVIITIGALLVPTRYRLRVFVALLLGLVSHLVLDLLLINPSGHSYPVLWPLTQYHPPTPNLFLSTDRWPAITAGAIAVVVWYTQPQRPRNTTRSL